MNVFLDASRGLYERYHHTHLRAINPPQAHFPSGPSKMYPQSINPPPHTSPSPVSQYNNSILPNSFPTESISPATTCSEENIDIQVFLE